MNARVIIVQATVVTSRNFVARWDGVDGWDCYRLRDNAGVGWTRGRVSDAQAHLRECERQYAAAQTEKT
jgi:hypothetical protein